ncbi:hypothetical protein AB8O53_32975, partial [Streptomyces pilosus]
GAAPPPRDLPKIRRQDGEPGVYLRAELIRRNQYSGHSGRLPARQLLSGTEACYNPSCFLNYRCAFRS